MQLPRTPYTNTSRQKQHGKAHAAGTHFPRVLSRRRSLIIFLGLPELGLTFPGLSWACASGSGLRGCRSRPAGARRTFPTTDTLSMAAARAWRARSFWRRSVPCGCGPSPWFPPVRGGSGFCRRRPVGSWLRGLPLTRARARPYFLFISRCPRRQLATHPPRFGSFPLSPQRGRLLELLHRLEIRRPAAGKRGLRERRPEAVARRSPMHRSLAARRCCLCSARWAGSVRGARRKTRRCAEAALAPGTRCFV